jgi:hypothetical protein
MTQSVGVPLVRRLSALVLVLLIFGAASVRPAAAQSSGPSSNQPAAPSEVVIGGGASPASNVQQCVDVQIGGEHAFGCLNQQLQREVDKVNPSLNQPPLDARSPDVRVGNVNEAAIREQYGSNYGRSVVPFRPPQPNFAAPPHH